VFPALSPLDAIDCAPRHAVRLGNRPVGSSVLPDALDLFGSQPGSRVILAIPVVQPVAVAVECAEASNDIIGAVGPQARRDDVELQQAQLVVDVPDVDRDQAARSSSAGAGVSPFRQQLRVDACLAGGMHQVEYAPLCRPEDGERIARQDGMAAGRASVFISR